MPYATMSDDVRLYYEECGSGTPIVFVHEFSGDFRSWEAQLQHFSRRYRCIAFNARGYPPSDVPSRVASYSPTRAVEDLVSILEHLRIRKAHVVGCSMGAQTTLHFGLEHPRRAISLTAVGAGSGSSGTRGQIKRTAEENARRYQAEGLAAMLARVSKAPNRIQLAQKNPRAWEDFRKRFMQHSAEGCAYTQRGIQAKRPLLLSLEARFRALKVPTHLMVGDEDPLALEASLFIRRVCPAARLTVAAATGHLVNAEEPELTNRLTEQFFALVESRRWRPRAA